MNIPIRKKTTISNILIILLLIPLVVSASQDFTSQQLVIKADKAYKNNKPSTAITLWQQSIKHIEQQSNQTIALINTQSKLIQIRLKLVLAYQKLGFIDTAKIELDKNLLMITGNLDSKLSFLILTIKVFNQASDVMLSTGKLLEAEKYSIQAIRLLKRTAELTKNKHTKLYANTLLQRANSATVLGDFEYAVDWYKQVIDITENKQFESIQLKAKVNQLFPLTQIHFNQPEKIIQAIKRVSSFIKDSRLTNKLQSNALITIGVLAYQQMDISQKQPIIDKLTALSYQNLNQAFNLSKQEKDNKNSSVSAGYLAKLYAYQKRNQEALALTQLASFYAQQVDIPEYLYQWYALIAKLELRLNNHEKALTAIEKSVTILAPIRNHLDIGVRSPIASFDKAVKNVYYLLADLYLQKAEKTNNPKQQQSLLIKARDTIESLKIAELENYFQDDCVANLLSSQKNLDQVADGVMVLYPISLPERLVLLLSSKQGIKQFSIKVTNTQVEQQTLLLRKNLQSRPHNRFLYQATQLYDWLITPIKQTLLAEKTDTLIIVADGPLRTIPFSTLYSGKQFLIEQFALVHAPSFSLIDPKPLTLQDSEILLAGLSESVQNFSALPGVPKELNEINLLLGGDKLLDKAYTMEVIENKLQSKSYSIVHLATHAQFTGILNNDFLLTYDDKITINKLKNIIGLGRFRDQPIELLTLSACQTAVGDDKAALGLAGVAIKAGARSALATLWFVDDESTSLAITEFYRQLSSNIGLSKAKALQEVQKKMIMQDRYWHPTYWAPFLLIGNWL